MSGVLRLSDVRGGYGGGDILKGVDLDVPEGAVTVIIGPNGAGKSTCIKAVAGLLKVSGGDIVLGGESIRGVSPEQLVSRGLGFVPQERNVFPAMTVQENLAMGAFLLKRGKQAAIDRAYDLFPPLRSKRGDRAGGLSGGLRQMVAIGRALVASPRVLLIDEPSAGLSPKYIHETLLAIKAVNASGVTVLMVEQNAKAALEMADHCAVIVAGATRHFLPAPEARDSAEIAAMFLGG